MTRLLLVETASPRRVRRKAEELLDGRRGSDADLTIVCTGDPRTVEYFREIPGARVVPLPRGRTLETLRTLRDEPRFDTAWFFWTGEKKYRRMKLCGCLLRRAETRVDLGDGGSFRLSGKALLRFAHFRWKHPLPSDHYEFVPTPESQDVRYYQGEKILIVESAEPFHVLRALDRLRERHLFRDPRYTVFCRNTPEAVRRFAEHPAVFEVRTHTEARDSWKHLRALRAQRFDGLVVFFTGDPSYWKIKFFAFLLGARHKVVFNENNDCFFFSFGSWLALLANRLGERARPGAHSRWAHRLRLVLFLAVKILVLPLRFAWLLLRWLRLRSAGLGAAG